MPFSRVFTAFSPASTDGRPTRFSAGRGACARR
jgi:hypothetical protein